MFFLGTDYAEFTDLLYPFFRVIPRNPCLKIINVSVLQHIPILATLPYFSCRHGH